MASASKTKIAPINVDEVLGKYAVADYSESIYPALYHAIREITGLKAKYALEQQGESFNWKEFNQAFKEALGDPKDKENRKYTLEQLIEYAHRKTGKTVEDLLVINRKSWQRRQEWEDKKKNDNNGEKAVDDEF